MKIGTMGIPAMMGFSTPSMTHVKRVYVPESRIIAWGAPSHLFLQDFSENSQISMGLWKVQRVMHTLEPLLGEWEV